MPGGRREARDARATYAEVLRSREFSALLVSQCLSILGDHVARIAVAVLVFERTGSALLSSATYACAYLPWLLGPLLATTGDRYPRLTVMVVCDLLRAGLVLLLAVPGVPLWAFFLVLLLVGLLAPPFDASRSAAMPDMLPGDRYVVGSALLNSAAQASQVAGFALGGALVATIGSSRALVLDAATFLVSAGALLCFVASRPAAQDSADRRGVVRDSLDAARHVLRDQHLRGLLAIATLGVALVIAPEGLAVAVAAEAGRGAGTAGLLTASLPLGFVLGSLVVSRLQPAERMAVLPVLGLVSGVPLLLTAFVGAPEAVMVLWVVAGAGGSMQLVAAASFMQALPAGLRSRAYGVAATAIMVTQGVVLLLGGALGELLGPRPAVSAVAAAGLLALPLATRALRPQEAAAQVAGDLVREGAR